jgi:hypothetical protein
MSATFQKTTYHEESLKEIKGYFEELRKEANYIGEDGDMVCVADNEEEALWKFKKRALEDEPKLDYLDSFNLENIGIGWLLLAEEQEKTSYETNWKVDYSGDKRSDFEVYVLEIS